MWQIAFMKVSLGPAYLLSIVLVNLEASLVFTKSRKVKLPYLYFLFPPFFYLLFLSNTTHSIQASLDLFVLKHLSELITTTWRWLKLFMCLWNKTQPFYPGAKYLPNLKLSCGFNVINYCFPSTLNSVSSLLSMLIPLFPTFGSLSYSFTGMYFSVHFHSPKICLSFKSHTSVSYSSIKFILTQVPNGHSIILLPFAIEFHFLSINFVSKNFNLFMVPHKPC